MCIDATEIFYSFEIEEVDTWQWVSLENFKNTHVENSKKFHGMLDTNAHLHVSLSERMSHSNLK